MAEILAAAGSTSAPSVVSVTPSSGYSASQTFAAVYSDVNGGSSISAVYMLFNSSVTRAGGCYVLYYPSSNLLYLKTDDGTANSTGITPGSAAKVSNSQCTVSAAGTSYSISGNTATLSVALSFAEAAATNIYLYAADENGNNSGFMQEGTWGVSAPSASVVSVTPSSGYAAKQTFTAIYSDTNGASSLTNVSILFNTQLTAAHGCYVWYSPGVNLFYLAGDTASEPTTGLTPGAPTTVSNSQCTLSGAGSSYAVSGNAATLTLALTFNTNSALAIYLNATDKNGSSSGWVQKGNWILSVAPPSVFSVTPNSGNAATQTFTGVYSDPNGALDLSTVSMLFNTQISASHACYVSYNPFLNLLYLTVDAGGAQTAGVTPGSRATVSNSQCTLSATGSSYTVSGNMATLNLALTFSGTAPTNIYLLASEKNGSNSGWVEKGTWGGALLNSIQVTLSSGSGLTTYSKTAGDVHLAQAASVSATPCGGQSVSLSLDNAALGLLTSPNANPAMDVCVPPGLQDAPFSLITGNATGSVTVSGFASQLQSGSATAVVAACPVTLSLASSRVSQGRAVAGTVTLCHPAPSPNTYGDFPNGVTIGLLSSAAGTASVTGSVTIPAGQTTGIFSVNGLSAGSVTLSTSALAGYGLASTNVTVTSAAQSITIPQNLAVSAGQTIPYPVSIGAPATSAVKVALAVSDLIGGAVLSPATVTIPIGATSPSTQPSLTALSAGTVFVTANAPGYGSETGTVNLSTSISLSPNLLTVLTSSTAGITLSSSLAAPAGGLTVYLAVSDATKATVPASVTIPAGQSTVTVSIKGLAPGNITLQASSAGLATASAAINVANQGSFSMIGDSRTVFLTTGAGSPNNVTAYQWFNAANALNGHNMQLVGNYGIGGDRSDQFLNADLAIALSDTAGTLIFNSAAVNDIGQCNSSYINSNGIAVSCLNVAAVASGNMITAANTALAAGKQVILVSELGSAAFTAAQVQAVFAYNQALETYAAATSGIFLFDATPYFWSSSTSSTSISLKPGVSDDGLHANTLGSFSIGQGFAKWINSAMPYNQYLTTHVAGAAGDYVTNALFQNPTGGSAIGAVTGTVPAEFTLRAAPGTTISASTTPDPNGFGNDLVLTITANKAATISMLTVNPPPSLWNPGETALFRANVSVAGGSSNFYCVLQPTVTTSNGRVSATDMLSDATYGAGSSSAYSYTLQTKPLAIPSGGTASGMAVNLNLSFSAAGSATVTISQFDAWRQ